jgi:hypothetical protein
MILIMIFIIYLYCIIFYILILPRGIKKELQFYHPSIKKTYNYILNKNLIEAKRLLLQRNKYLLKYHPYNKNEDRIKQINKDKIIQTIYNYINLS